jgi:RNA polymerase sigma-70 factor, ECF subfamily
MNDQDSQTREELTRLWRHAEPTVEAFVFASIARLDDAEDVMQQTALTIARRFKEYDASRPFVAWALWLAKTQVIDCYRRRQRDKVVFSEPFLDHLADSFAKPTVEIFERRLALQQCVERLPDKSRRILALKYVDKQDIDHIAQAVESTSGSVRVMLHRLRNLLADCVTLAMRRESHERI